MGTYLIILHHSLRSFLSNSMDTSSKFCHKNRCRGVLHTVKTALWDGWQKVVYMPRSAHFCESVDTLRHQHAEHSIKCSTSSLLSELTVVL